MQSVSQPELNTVVSSVFPIVCQGISVPKSGFTDLPHTAVLHGLLLSVLASKALGQMRGTITSRTCARIRPVI